MDKSEANTTYVDEEINFTANGNKLYGILRKPQGKARYPAIVQLHGSERQGVTHGYYNDHAANFVRSDYAALFYDSPGVGRSKGSILGENLDTRASEALSAVHYLQSRDDIDPSHVGLYGHSQGGWVCQKTAALSSDVAFIIPVSGPGVSPERQEVYRVEMQSRGAGFPEDDVKKAVLIRKLLVDLTIDKPRYETDVKEEAKAIGPGPWDRLIETCYEGAGSDFNLPTIVSALSDLKDEPWTEYLYIDRILGMVNGLDSNQWQMVKKGYSALMLDNPEESLSRITVPVLAIFGGSDQYLPVEESIDVYTRCLKSAGNNNFGFKVFPGADHMLMVDGDYAQGYFDSMVEWLKKLAFLQFYKNNTG